MRNVSQVIRNGTKIATVYLVEPGHLFFGIYVKNCETLDEVRRRSRAQDASFKSWGPKQKWPALHIRYGGWDCSSQPYLLPTCSSPYVHFEIVILEHSLVIKTLSSPMGIESDAGMCESASSSLCRSDQKRRTLLSQVPSETTSCTRILQPCTKAVDIGRAKTMS
jgi:hypothetical protein